MVEAIHTSEMVYGIGKGTGRSTGKLWAGSLTMNNQDTIDTGFDTIEGCAFTMVETTDVDGATELPWIKDVTGGIVTLLVAEIATFSDQAGDVFGIVVGSKR